MTGLRKDFPEWRCQKQHFWGQIKSDNDFKSKFKLLEIPCPKTVIDEAIDMGNRISQNQVAAYNPNKHH